MSKKSRRQRQRAKQRNYAQVYNQPRPATAAHLDAAIKPALVMPTPQGPSASLLRMQQAKNADLWDSIIFAGGILVVLIVIYYINLRTPILDQFGNFISNLFHLSF